MDTFAEWLGLDSLQAQLDEAFERDHEPGCRHREWKETQPHDRPLNDGLCDCGLWDLRAQLQAQAPSFVVGVEGGAA